MELWKHLCWKQRYFCRNLLSTHSDSIYTEGNLLVFKVCKMTVLCINKFDISAYFLIFL